MKEILITSSALILVLLLLRRVFHKTLSRRWQYALWALVLVRLLLPVSLLPAADFSVLTATAPVQQAVAQRVSADRIFYSQPQGQVPLKELEERNIDPEDVPTAQDLFVLGESDPDNRFSTNWLVRDPETNTVTRYAEMTVGPWDFLDAIWKIGMALMGAFFLLSNLLFYRRLRKNREIFETTALPGTRRVYLVPEGVIPSPCLFGRSIYITPAVADDPVKLRHVLAHESTHAKHLDPLWSLLRCVCLTVYWFDPLIWVAASCSKTDCELACDESVLKALGESERIGYGETLVSLIPVKKGPANPMLAATTMTAGKRELKDRITRIAQKPRQLMAAVVAVAVLATIAAACTFTGGTASPTPAPSASKAPSEAALRPLTAEELRWFNEEFFNSSGADQTGTMDYAYNIRNQFANPGIRYDKPEDIDLYELFYLEGEVIPDDELSIVWDGSREDIPCGAYKLSVEAVNDILMGYTGLTLDKTSKIGLDDFTYSQEHNAYYWMHGDTNYCGDLQFTVGTREGDIVRLYHTSDYAGTAWYCVTLTDKGDGQYWFVSNQVSARPTISTPLPTWEPEQTIPLDGLEPQTAHVVGYLTNYPAGDFPGGYENRLDNWDFDGHHVMAYKTADGQARVALVKDDGSFDVFYNMDAEQYGGMFFFHDLFGRDGFYVDHTSGEGSLPQRDYYYFNEGDRLTQLLETTTSVRGGAFQLDLDGDGNNELIADENIYFQRDGQVYRANLVELVASASPDVRYWSLGTWNIYGKYCVVTGIIHAEKSAVRYLYFDGENLLVYKDEKPTTDHVVDGAALNVPAAVVEQAKAYALSVYEGQSEYEGMGTLDDWRIESFDGPYQTAVGDLTVEAWAFNYECHTTTPDQVVLAGGRYITEDNWVSPGYPGCDWLFFLRDSDGSLTYLWNDMMNDMGPGSPLYDEYVADRLVELGYRREVGSFSAAARDAAAKFDRLIERSGGQVTLRLAPAEGEAAAYTVDPDEGNGPYYRNQFTDTAQYTWRHAVSVRGYPEGASLTITDPSWEYYIRLWEGSDLVMIKPDNDGAYWYEVKQNFTSSLGLPDAFSLLRQWFDEAEWAALTGNITIPDQGQSHQAVAQAWVEAHEGAMAKFRPGGQHTCTYVKTVDVKAEATGDTPESWFPQELLPYEHFRFSYSTIFVPENDTARNYLMAGNTGNYTGSDPDVPEGAFQYWHIGSMYLKDGTWYCASVGTG